MSFIEPIAKLISALTKLPGVGPKTAQRYAYSIINMGQEEALALVEAIREARGKVRYCSKCGNFTDADPCVICRTRDKTIICVVKEPKDVLALEKVRSYKGVYHVLHGTINPLEGKGPDDIRIRELLKRIEKGGVREVIMATNTDAEGDATAMYIARLLKGLGVKVTRIAQGMPIGADIEYADEVTLSKAIEDRKSMD
ncbi:MAG: recombination protein RecR [Clostridiales bacterium]|jgi:recombination protein RecR|nr:recombination protein RecR [Clostridiales bacterium]